MHDELDLMTYSDVAMALKCCVRYVRDAYVKTGLLKCVRLGRLVRFRPGDVKQLESFLAGDLSRGAIG